MLKRNLVAPSFLVDRPQLDEVPEYFQSYIDRVPAGNLQDLLEQQELYLIEIFRKYEHQLDQPYATDKWTLRQVLLHIIDVERVFQFRILYGIRESGVQVTGFDHDKWAEASLRNQNDLNTLLLELQAVRSQSLSLLHSIHPSEIHHTVLRDELEISVLAMICLLWGHADHHVQVMLSHLAQ